MHSSLHAPLGGRCTGGDVGIVRRLLMAADGPATAVSDAVADASTAFNANAGGDTDSGTIAAGDVPRWLFMDPPRVGFPREVLVVSNDGQRRKDLFQAADSFLSQLRGPDGMEIVDDANWTVFPEIGEQLKVQAGVQACFCVAMIASRRTWAIGVGMKGRCRFSATKLALAATLALQMEDEGSPLPSGVLPDAAIGFLGEARTKREMVHEAWRAAGRRLAVSGKARAAAAPRGDRPRVARGSVSRCPVRREAIPGEVSSKEATTVRPCHGHQDDPDEGHSAAAPADRPRPSRQDAPGEGHVRAAPADRPRPSCQAALGDEHGVAAPTAAPCPARGSASLCAPMQEAVRGGTPSPSVAATPRPLKRRLEARTSSPTPPPKQRPIGSGAPVPAPSAAAPPKQRPIGMGPEVDAAAVDPQPSQPARPTGLYSRLMLSQGQLRERGATTAKPSTKAVGPPHPPAVPPPGVARTPQPPAGPPPSQAARGPQQPTCPPPAALLAARGHAERDVSPESPGPSRRPSTPPRGKRLQTCAPPMRQWLRPQSCSRLVLFTGSAVVVERLHWKPDLLLDMRCFKDPDAGPLKLHDGHHPDIISRMIAHECFPEWLHWLRGVLWDQLDAAGSRGSAEVTVVLYCRSGQHRAVAGSVILRSIAKREGLQCEPANHMTARRCGSPCCSGRGPGVRQAMMDAWEMWERLPAEGFA
mmetsp:Transcript_102699/g.306763  ORF Transcript_102699/g.306763 Transcript_102699/m.306763 type:complete len:700 (+) Transcript_102699:67-2166(+)